MSLACGAVEVWLPERRHHLLEDPTGMIAAEEAGDPRLAHGDHDEGAEVGGRTWCVPADPERGPGGQWQAMGPLAPIRRCFASRTSG